MALIGGTYIPDNGSGGGLNLSSLYPQAPKPPISSMMPQNTNPVSNYSAAVTQQAGDYDSIMAQYLNAARAATSGNNLQTPTFSPLTPQTVSPSSVSFKSLGAPQQAQFNPVNFSSSSFSPASYTQSPEWKRSLEEAANFVKTGGISGQEQQDIRARGVSPIRSVYANAQQGLNRQRALQGGYSPNYTAASAKLARELSSLVSDKTTDVNGMIAQLLVNGRLAGLNAQTSLSSQEEGLINQINLANSQGINQSNQFNAAGANQANQFNSSGALQANTFNAGAVNDANQFNSQGMLQAMLANMQAQNQANQINATSANQANQYNNQMPFQIYQAQLDAANQAAARQMQAIQGQANLYGTTPALVNTFGNQMNTAEQMYNQNTQNMFSNLITSGVVPPSNMGGGILAGGNYPSPIGSPNTGISPVSRAYFG